VKKMKKLFAALFLVAVCAGAALAAPRTVKLVLLRHGQSVWNLEKRFTGWSDIRLTRLGVKQAFDAGMTMKEAGMNFDVVHTSLLDRAIATAWLAISAMDLRWIPVEKYWRLNERCYGDLEGKTHKEIEEAHGKEQMNVWRRSYGTPPPPLSYDDPRSPINDPAYYALDSRMIPQAESLKDVIDRVGPYWCDVLRPTLYKGENVLVVGHSTCLRALSSWIEPDLTEEQLMKLEIPNATPVVYTIEFEGANRKIVSREVMKVVDHPLPPPPPDVKKRDGAGKAPEAAEKPAAVTDAPKEKPAEVKEEPKEKPADKPAGIQEAVKEKAAEIKEKAADKAAEIKEKAADKAAGIAEKVLEKK